MLMTTKYYNRDGEIAFRMWMFANAMTTLERMPNLGKVTILLAKVSAFGNSDLFKTQATPEEKADLETIRKALLAIHEPEKEEETTEETIVSIRSALKSSHNPAVEKFPTARSLKSAHFITDLEMDQQDFEQFLYEIMWLTGKEFPHRVLSVDSTVGELAEYLEHYLS